MRKILRSWLLLILPLGLIAAETSLDDALRQTALEYTRRIDAATHDLNSTRQRIAADEQPLLDQLRKLQDQVVTLESELAQLETTQAQSADALTRSQRELENLKRNLNYVTSQGLESVKALQDSLVTGESQFYAGPLATLQSRLENPASPPDVQVALDALSLVAQRIVRATGGYAAPGQALVGPEQRVAQGTFAFLGPQSFFVSGDNVWGVASPREGGATYPAVHAVAAWPQSDASALLAGRRGTFVADATGGKALRLEETRGSLLKHIHLGGPVAYLILAVGALSLVITLTKIDDARRLRLASAAQTQAVLEAVAAGRSADAHALCEALPATTREVYRTGLTHVHRPRAALEEHLAAQLQQLRLHYERRLPLLTVIATASPLLGLLGTVMGMVRTFALITVFGTGNAAKLSSGISEVLVTTELGLAVAIPTLVAHGFLAHRIQKQLALLEKQTVEFAAAAGEAAGTVSPTAATAS